MWWLFGPILLLWISVLFLFGVGISIHLIRGLRHSSQSSSHNAPADDGKTKGFASFLDKRYLGAVRSRPPGEKVDRGIAQPRRLLP